MKFLGRSLTVGRRETTRGDGLAWWNYGLWFIGKGARARAGSCRSFTIEYTAGERGRTRQKELNTEGYWR